VLHHGKPWHLISPMLNVYTIIMQALHHTWQLVQQLNVLQASGKLQVKTMWQRKQRACRLCQPA
jgi:hypothetical protein